MHIPQRFLIVSGTADSRDDSTAIQFVQDNYPGTVPVVGWYEGAREVSLLLPLSDFAAPGEELLARFLGAALRQKSILWVEHGQAELFGVHDGSRKHLGPWREVSEETAHASESYSRIGERYFVAGK